VEGGTVSETEGVTVVSVGNGATGGATSGIDEVSGALGGAVRACRNATKPIKPPRKARITRKIVNLRFPESSGRSASKKIGGLPMFSMSVPPGEQELQDWGQGNPLASGLLQLPIERRFHGMIHRKSFLAALSSLAVFVLFSAVSARADDLAWRTRLHLDTATEIPGMLLQPGDYVIKVVDTKEPRKIVQFLNSDETQVIQTVVAVPNYRVRSEGNSEFTYFERAAGGPPALKTWFYPANNFGVEFVYPKAKAEVIAQTTHQEVYATESTKPEVSEKIVAVTPERKEVPVQEEVAPAPAPMPAPAPPTSLPQTGSDLPLVALAGMMALALAAVLRLASARRA
jgi:LPXTG-motif cell wall-anchored protein